jgi:hypothetical protein
MWHIDPLLGYDCERNETQQFLGSGKSATITVLSDAVFSMLSAPRLYDSADRVQFS